LNSKLVVRKSGGKVLITDVPEQDGAY